MRIAYIAHPIGGDVEGNLMAIGEIIQRINLEEPDVVPFAPYFADCIVLEDIDPGQRRRGIKNNTELLKRGFIDEVRLYGDRISKGMKAEIDLAHELGIPVRPMTKTTEDQYCNIVADMTTVSS